MKKNKLKSQAGVTLTTLMITIVILSILVAIVIRNVDTGTDLRNYNYMKADIELLYSKIMTYYNENNSIPTTGDAFNAKTTLGGQVSSRDNDNYYQIDLSKLYNITLNFGGGTLQNGDVYIINEQSHEVYYFKGVVVDDQKYYHPVNNTTTGDKNVDNTTTGDTTTENHNWEISGDTLTCAHCNKTYTIGEEINYTATGKGSTSITAAMSGYTSDQTLTADTDTKWVVLGAENTNKAEDETNETLLITTEKPTTGTIYLKGAAAYNNCIDEINRMCKELYGENARGMTIEDVNNCLQYTPAGGMYTDASGNEQTTNNFTTKLSDLPIWSSITYYKTPDGKNTKEALGEYLLDGYWYGISSTGATDARKNVILASSGKYWLASRGTVLDAESKRAYICLGAVRNGLTTCIGVYFESAGNDSISDYGLRPLVSLTSEI